MVVVVKNLHAFPEDAIFANGNCSQAGNGGSRNVRILPDRELAIRFDGDEIGLIESHILCNVKFRCRRDVKKIVRAQPEARMDPAARRKELTSLMLINTSLCEVPEFRKDKA